MGTHTLPSDETARRSALSRYRILDSPPEADFDEMVQLAASIYKAPIAAITFIDQDRQWVKAAIGLDVSHIDRACGLCSFTIQGTDPVVIEDAAADVRFSAHALVRAYPHVRFYCGAPIVTHDGYAVGTIAVMDSIPRVMTAEDCLTIRRLARQTAALLELRLLRSERSSIEARDDGVATLTEAAFVIDRSGRILQANQKAEELLGAPASDLRGRLLHECVHRHGGGGCEVQAGSCDLVQGCLSGTMRLGEDDVFVSTHGALHVRWNYVPRSSQGDWIGGIVSVRDLTMQKRNEEVLRLMAPTTRLTGTAFLQELVETLARTIGADYGFCLRMLPEGARAQSVAGWGPEGRLEPMDYDLTGTPCEHVLREEFCHYPSGVQTLFSQDHALRELSIESYMALTLPSPTGVPIGWIAMLGRTPLQDAERAEALLRVAAGRAGSELGRYLAEEQLKESEERYALALRGSADGIWDWNVITGQAILSARSKALLGFAEDELPDHESSFFNRVHPDDLERVKAEIHTHFARRTPYDVQCRVLHKDGTYRWVQTRAQALWDEQGRAYRMVGATTDITERKQSEDAARRWQQVFDQAQLGLAHADLATNTFLAVNPAFARQCGYTVEELIGQSIFTIYPPEEHAALLERSRRIHETGSLTFETIHRRKDGSLFPVLVEVMLIRDAQGVPVSRVAYAKDITDSKQAEQARRASEERFRAAYRNATVGMSIADVSGRIQEVNQALCRILGYSEQELLARTFQSLTHPDDLGKNLDRLKTLLAGTRVYDVFEKRYLRKDGSVVWAQVGVSVIRDEHGTPLYTLAMVQDITERKRAQEALQLAKYTVDHATEAIYWVGADAELLDVNDSACSMLGYSKEEFRRMKVHDINPYFQADAWHTFWAQTRARGRVSFESCHRAKDGRLIPVDVNITFIRYNGVECHFAFVRDITERKSAESALRASEERFHFAIEATNDGMWDWDMRTDEVYYSPQWIRLLGYEPEDVTPSRAFFVTLVHPEDVARTTETLQAHVDGRMPLQEIELRLRRKSGEYRWYLNRGKVVSRAQDGRPLRMVGTITDISERKQSERERDEALSNLQTIMETVPDVIFALALDGRIAKWNLRLEMVTGYTPEELQGKSALEMVPPEEAEKTAAAIQEAYEKGYAELEGHLLAKDGRTMLYHWTGAPYRDLQGRVIGVTGVGRDITERKKVEQMLASETRVLEMMGSDAPLSAVLAEICLMIEGLSNGVLCSVLLLEDDEAHLRHGAGPSLPESYARALDGIAIGPASGSCGTAAFTGQQVVVADIASHPFWAEFRELALAHGLRACWSTPILSATGKILGTFAIYNQTPRQRTEEAPIVARASHLACLAIERKRTESALRLMQFSIQQAVDAVFWVNAEARILDVNEAACAMLGYTRDELLSKTVHDIDTNFPRESWQARWQHLKVSKSFSFESRHQKKDGAVIQTDTTINFLVHEGREYYCAFMRDITDRKRAEAQLHLTQFAIERAGDMVFWVDEAARLLLVNAAACERMGYTRDELLRMAVPDIDPNYQMEVWARHWQELRETGRQRLETQHRSKSGEVYPVEVVANFVVFEGREYNFATVRDMSERKRTELRLRFSEERFRLVAQATNDVLWDWDLVTNEHWWSPNACEKFGYDPQREPSVDAWTRRLHPEDKAPILDTVQQAIQSDVQTLAGEYRFLLGDGTYGHFLDRAHIVRNEEGTAIRMIGAMIDVTGPKRAYASLEEAYRRFQAMSQELQMVESNERRRLSRELHDELGQLLTSLKFDLASVKRSVAARPKALGPRSQERLARALETTDLLFVRLRQIVRALRPPVLEELGMKAGLEALIADVQARTELRCSLVFEQGERRPSRFPTLETAFYRIVQELLTNVIRHARATNVAIAITSGQQDWRMTVKDDGIGFDVAGLAPTGRFGLRGIRERVEILGGQVDILSSSETGTWVQVVIPVSSEPEPAGETDHDATASRRRRRKAVDD
ncbi:MAG: PAS domain S-box protein [Nitrospira sp.]|nr:PAS domain S-box protein [Nitrospira sp.]